MSNKLDELNEILKTVFDSKSDDEKLDFFLIVFSDFLNQTISVINENNDSWSLERISQYQSRKTWYNNILIFIKSCKTASLDSMLNSIEFTNVLKAGFRLQDSIKAEFDPQLNAATLGIQKIEIYQNVIFPHELFVTFLTEKIPVLNLNGIKNDKEYFKFHCEIKGFETSLNNTKVLSKINGIINTKLLENPRIDFNRKLIYSSEISPIKFHSQLFVPDDLKSIIGDLFTIISDNKELEQTTHILSNEGLEYLMGNQLIKVIKYLEKYKILNFQDSSTFISVDDISIVKHQIINCESWGISYASIGQKYFYKRIVETKINQMKYVLEGFGAGVLDPGFEIGISDVSEKNPIGTGYQFKTEGYLTPVNLCSNESAIDFCKKNNCIVYYKDFINNCKMRILTQYSKSINENLNQHYKFRSSPI